MIAGLILKMSWALLMFSVVIIFNTVFSPMCLSVNDGGVFVLLLLVFLSSGIVGLLLLVFFPIVMKNWLRAFAIFCACECFIFVCHCSWRCSAAAFSRHDTFDDFCLFSWCVCCFF